MRSVNVAIIAGAIILVAAIAVLIRVQKPHDLRTTMPVQESARDPRAGQVTDPGARSARSARVQERLRRLREEQAARQEVRRVVTPATSQYAATKPRRAARVLPPHDILTEEQMEVSSLRSTLVTSPDPDEREEAAFFLSALDDEKGAYQALLLGLQDPDAAVRLSVVEALEDFDDQLTPAALEPALSDPDPEVRFEAVSLLGDMETPDALAAVRGLQDDPDEDVRSLAEGIVELAD